MVEESKDFENIKKFINLEEDEDLDSIDEEYIRTTLDKFKPYFNQTNQSGGMMASLMRASIGSFMPSPLSMQF